MHWSIMITALLVFAVGGCSHLPVESDTSEDVAANPTLEVTISPQTEVAVRGAVIPFDVTVRNISDEPVRVPRNPELQFCWVYRTGRINNHVMDPLERRFVDVEDSILLQPGEETAYSKDIETYYFRTFGLTRFQAVYHSFENENPELDEWFDGKLVSNQSVVKVMGP